MFLKKRNKEECFFVVWVLQTDRKEPDLYQELFSTYREARDFLFDLREFDNLLTAKIFLGKEIKNG